ncbi:MAG TPA: bifunctional 2-C-methyl-D-erythritol 4-phosphate cytidylyltransferase/2-C-methyl-D-erythritol 2,4-cyclodiphosphate synthase [Arcobacter sp.]|nr:bifunctional 2-C-methyl-D-erythritol 4-phosphate cytidylyltransferase/2-C-methyl-D-erythritol 2,4-cyclodiphosphate synthase [Arcobacter sp.]
MLDTTLIVLCAGNSTRFGLQPKKQWLRCQDEPLWLKVTTMLSSYSNFQKVIVVSHKNELNYMKNYSNDFTFIAGGNTRQKSMSNALQNVTSKFVMISDVARACIPKQMVIDLLNAKDKADCIVPYLSVSDTVVYQNDTINRDEVKLIQTPQLSSTSVLIDALKNTTIFTDDSSAISKNGGSVFYIKGNHKAQKLTFGNEIENLNCLDAPSNDTFVGYGIDIHPFEQNKQMVLGGVDIACQFGFKAHSDGDVLIHSIIDALLGGIGAGDIGEFFPDTDDKYKDADSKELLKEIVSFVCNVGYEIVNVDVSILAEIPKINPHKDNIKTQLSKLLNIPKYKINIKATTAEKLGFIGREEAVAVHSTASLKYYDWTK